MRTARAPSAESHFSWLRTRLSAERTLMSWVRTSIALIGFGFTMVKFLEYLQPNQGVHGPEAPRVLGLVLIGIGIAALFISVLQYRRLVAHLWRDFPSLSAQKPTHTPVLAVAMGLILAGLFAFFAVLLRVN